MSQAWLFGAEPDRCGPRVQELRQGQVRAVRFHPDLASWQALARRFLRERTTPESLWWQADAAEAPEPTEPGPATPSAGDSLADGQLADPAGLPDRAAEEQIRVPRTFLEKARLVACHRSEDRWALLYQLLWRIALEERHLLELHGDPQVAKLNAYAHAVSRDVHKMKAFVRFRMVSDWEGDRRPGAAGIGADSDGIEEPAEPRYVAWFEPEHHIVEQVSGFFRRRFGGMRWSILTPDRCAHWEGEGPWDTRDHGADAALERQVWFTAGVDRQAAPQEDAFEDAWRLYYRSIFNPARLKVRAMLAEMPQKYWRNLPEARVIPALVQAAHQRTAGMQASIKPADELRCGPRPAPLRELAARRLAQLPTGTLEQLALQAAGCRRCPLWEPATQTVWGEGPRDARIMLVGEQPGDQEDLAGRPFVGPAGRLLDRAPAQAGLDRRLLYLTNAVKHFKFKSRGKRRIHDKPLDAEILACVPWLEEEIARVAPALIVCLGATAARARLGRAVRINEERGRLFDGSPPRLLTFHPSYLLRLTDPAAAADAFGKLVADLRLAARVGLASHPTGNAATASTEGIR